MWGAVLTHLVVLLASHNLAFIKFKFRLSVNAGLKRTQTLPGRQQFQTSHCCSLGHLKYGYCSTSTLGPDNEKAALATLV
jgi:hypothetical protein